MYIAINRLLMKILLVHIQHVKLDIKNENKTISVLILLFPGKNAFWNQRKSLKNDSAKLFVSLRKFNHICRPSFYTKNGYKKEICKILGSEWIRIWNIARKNLLFFGCYIHAHQKLPIKNKRVFFLWMEVSSSLDFYAS